MSALTKNASYALKEIQMVLDDDRAKSGYITCIIAGRWVIAKVYDVPSDYGVGGFSRVSKLAIGKTMIRDPMKNFFEQMDYNYDRGLDFTNLSEEDVSVVVSALEKLPVTTQVSPC